TLGLALAATGFVVAPAWADDTQAQADRTATTIAAAAGGTIVNPSPVGDASTATANSTQVTLPATSDGAVTMVTTDQSIKPLVTPVSISLPRETGGKHAKQAKNGTMVYPRGSGNSADAAVQVLADGSVRLSTVLASKNSPTRFTYTIAGATPELQADGSVNLVQTTDTGGALIQATVGTIAPAWAKDANGRPVATHYEVKGNGQLVQVVTPDKNTTYPVVADPDVGFCWSGGLCLNLVGMRALQLLSLPVSVLYGSSVVLGYYVPWLGAVLAVASIVGLIPSLVDAMSLVLRASGIHPYHCYQANLIMNRGKPAKRVAASNCYGEGYPVY
ncbi:MAG: hypothetical protein FWC46_09805, partial [Actinomycetia bacterium]|nr:hypothetical protein [Actinomycetes bacterium]